MAKFIVRRHSEPEFVHALMEAVNKIASQKQCPNEERIVRAIQQEYDWTRNEVIKQLKLAVKDGFFTQVTAVSSHGKSKGVPQTAFRIRNKDKTEEKEKPQETHDWYCWSCHGAGEIIQCDHCPRVFHRMCARDGSVSAGKWKCPSCQPQKLPHLVSSKSTEFLSKMLLYTLERMKEKAKDFLHPINLDEHDDYLDFVFKPMDLSLLEKNAKEKRYKTPKEFREEAQWMLHNSIIYFGEITEMTELAEAIMKDCDGELEELIRCADCYMMSNVRTNNWFAKPCFYPHELVWAKMTGEPPWPSKLLAWNEQKSKALVRFFGSGHQRAWVLSKNIRPIQEKPDVKKRPQRWLQAVEEMKLYEKQLGQQKPNQRKKNHERQKSCNFQEVSVQTDSQDVDYQKANSLLQKKLDEISQRLVEEIKKNDELNKRKDERIKILQNHAKTLEDHLNSAVLSLESERNRAKDYKQKYEQLLQDNTRPKSLLNSDEHHNNYTPNGTLVLHEDHNITTTHMHAGSRPRERKVIDESKINANKDRLEREKAIAEAVKKAKKDYERHFQRTLQSTRDEGQRALKEAVRSTKRKQWCAYCSNEAFYPCCWNTSYCTLDCQKADWCSHRFHCMRLPCNCGGTDCKKPC